LGIDDPGGGLVAPPLLAAKLYILLVRPEQVLRPRLVQRLKDGLEADRAVTLFSAPAGFGKTTLLCDWLTGREKSVTWIALDEGDNTLNRFLAYLIGALQTISRVVTIW
jgi:LuxR family maltose regulon positive regulatory protein